MISRTSWKGRFWLGLEIDGRDRALSEVADVRELGGEGAKIKNKTARKREK